MTDLKRHELIPKLLSNLAQLSHVLVFGFPETLNLLKKWYARQRAQANTSHVMTILNQNQIINSYSCIA